MEERTDNFLKMLDIFDMRTKVRMSVLLIFAFMFLPLFFAHPAFAVEHPDVWCTSCKQQYVYVGYGELNTDTYLQLKYEHPSEEDTGVRCANTSAGAEVYVELDVAGEYFVSGYYVSLEEPDADTVTDSTVLDENADTIGTQEAFGADFIRMMLDTIISTGEEEESFNSVSTLMDFTFELILDVIDTIVNTAWYWFLVWCGILLLIMRFFYGMAKDKSFDTASMTKEAVFKMVSKLLIGMIVLFLLPYCVRFFVYLSQAAVILATENPFLDMESAATEAEITTAEILEASKETMITALGFEAGGITKLPQNIGALIQGIICLILPYIVSLVCSVGLLFVCFSRVIDLARMVALSPLSVTDISVAGENSHGVQYMLEIGGVCFQGIAIIVTVFVADVASAVVIDRLLGEFSELTGTLTGVCQVATYMTAINLAKLVGVMRAGEAAKNALR